MLDKGRKKHIYVHKHTPITSPLLPSSSFSSPTLSLSLSSSFSSSFLLSSSPLFPPASLSFLSPSSAFFPLLHPPPLLLFLTLLPPLCSLSFSPFSASTLPFSLFSSFLLSSPCFPVTFITIFCLFPLFFPFFILLRCFSFFLSLLPPLCPLSFSPFSTSTLPFSLEILQLYLLPVRLSPSFAPVSTLFQPLYFFSHSPIFLSISLLHSHISCSLSPPCLFPPPIAFFFPSLASCSHLSPSTQALHVKLIFFIFSLSRPKLSPLIHCLHLPHSTKNSSPLYPPSLLFLLLISLTQTIKIPTNNQLFPQLLTKFRFPPKALPTLLLFAPKTVLDAPNILLFTNGKYTGHTANPSIISVIVQNSSPLSSALHSKMA